MSVTYRRVIPMPSDQPAPTFAELLEFEARWPRHSGHKESAVIDELKLMPGRYYVLLLRAASSLEGQQHDAVTAHRVLRRERAAVAAMERTYGT
jgi:hypothetical protein